MALISGRISPRAGGLDGQAGGAVPRRKAKQAHDAPGYGLGAENVRRPLFSKA